MRNPAFRDPAFGEGGTAAAQNISAQELEEAYNRPTVDHPTDDVMTIQDSLAKSGLTFVVLLAGAAIGWLTLPVAPWLWIGAAVVGLVLALVNIFKKEPSPALILLYALAQGVFLGGISAFYEGIWPGIVFQAVLATFAVVGVTLALFASGRIRASKRATKVFLIAMIGYLVFSLVNIVLMLTGVTDDPWGLRGEFSILGIPLGVIIGVFVVLLGAYSLVLDFDFIQRGVRNGAPRKYGWTGAFGIMVTVVWLYLEILRILAIARD